jgi:hypothetical protein
MKTSTNSLTRKNLPLKRKARRTLSSKSPSKMEKHFPKTMLTGSDAS